MSVVEADEVADLIAIRDVIDRYAHYADRRDAVRQAATFTVDGRVELYDGDPDSTPLLETVTGREALAETFRGLIARYDATTYLNGQSRIRRTAADTATAETYCLAHHLLHEDGVRMLLVMSIRYLDTFTRTDEGWLIAERKLIFEWTDRRPSAPQ